MKVVKSVRRKKKR